jgi:hypothetical protein
MYEIVRRFFSRMMFTLSSNNCCMVFWCMTWKQLFVVEQISRFFTRQFNLLLTRINFWQQSYFRFNKKNRFRSETDVFRVRVRILVFRIRQRTKTTKTSKNTTQKTKTMSYTDQQQKWGWTQVLAEKGKKFLFLLRHPSCYLY